MLNTGSRAQVMHDNALKTSGGLYKKDLKYNKYGKIVSKKASSSARKSNNLVKAGYTTKKGVFGSIHNGGENKSKENQNKEHWKKVSKKRIETMDELTKNHNMVVEIQTLYNELNLMEAENKQNDETYKLKLKDFMERTGMSHVEWYKCIKQKKKMFKKHMKK